MTALLATVRFQDGTTQPYTPPRDTGDLRAVTCGPHHPACDCREAKHAEDVSELRADRDRWKALASELMWRLPHDNLADMLADQHAGLTYYRQRRRDGLL